MTTTTLRQCFVPPYPRLYNFPGDRPGNSNPSSSSITTAETNPPKFAHEIEQRDWIDTCNNIINGLPGNELENEGLDSKEAIMYHKCEADVVRSAALYILHPLNQALSAHPATTGAITCLAEHSSNGLRADITYFRNPAVPSPGAEKRAFAVVEFKRRGLIDAGEFRTAQKLDASHSVQDVMNQKNNICAKAASKTDATFYAKYSCTLMKQAAAYATAQRTRYIALFNWDVLVLVRFSGLRLLDSNGRLREKDDLIIEGVGEWCQTTIITQSERMRPALLGFLGEAFCKTPL